MPVSVLGVDPGLTGGWAIYTPSTGAIELGDLPVSGEGASKQVEGAIFADLLDEHPTIAAASIEKVGPMPHDGPIQAFKFGASTGEMLGVVKGRRLPLYRPTPAVWKRHFGLIGKNKDASRQLAIARFPAIASQIKWKKDHGRAEALLIAVHHAETNPAAFA